MAQDFLGRELNVGDFVVTMHGRVGTQLTFREIIAIEESKYGAGLSLRRAGAKQTKAEPMRRWEHQVLKISPEDALLYKLSQ